MATASNVLQFRRSQILADTATTDTSRDSPNFRTTLSDETYSIDAPRVSIEDLYPEQEACTPELGAALRLLGKGLEFVDGALDALQTGSAIASDDAMLQLQALVRELFNCRILGDGFGAVINALLASLENRLGSPLNQLQIRTIGQVLRRVRSEPFLQFSSALDEIEKLEQAAFMIEPQGFEHLADWLDG